MRHFQKLVFSEKSIFLIKVYHGNACCCAKIEKPANTYKEKHDQKASRSMICSARDLKFNQTFLPLSKVKTMLTRFTTGKEKAVSSFVHA